MGFSLGLYCAKWESGYMNTSTGGSGPTICRKLEIGNIFFYIQAPWEYLFIAVYPCRALVLSATAKLGKCGVYSAWIN